MTISTETIARHASRLVPRYTSYPTAPHFHRGIGAASYRDWLAELPDKASLSLYVHIPFCDTLCWFCGCHTKITRQYQPIAAYLRALEHEIEAVAAAAPRGARVTHIHWGGGSPTILSASDIRRLSRTLRDAFAWASDAEFAVEIDPRGLDEERIDALGECGLTRVSVGVQDFDPAVQAAINRAQSVEETRRVIEACRARGARSLNIDAIYGLPGQHATQLARTLDEVIALAPDRIALFGYAHVPWMKRHQSLIPEDDLPGPLERHGLAEMAGDTLLAAGFERIGVDHFARPSDPLAVAAREGRVRRNFQGYTVDPADALIGLGASAIGRLPRGYIQNEPAIAEYRRLVHGQGLAIVRGVEFSEEDKIRGDVIERLMCDLAFSAKSLRGRPDGLARELIETARTVVAEDRDGFVAPTTDGFMVTERGRPFVRAIATRFDAYLATTTARHSAAV
jgi:oxygen-independent coproporphyrinogen-3 oxidase